jgi:ABC-type multidrug transport system fused ATPase/permease subunit
MTSSILNSFTRAAGAAQRVISLMDNLPDIDPESGTTYLPSIGVQLVTSSQWICCWWAFTMRIGKPVTTVKGDIRLEGVNFHYQMRPGNTFVHFSLSPSFVDVCAFH